MTVSQNAVVAALNAFCFDSIWNAVVSEYAVQLQLTPVSDRLMINAIVGELTIQLPSLGLQYAVYKVGADLFGDALILPAHSWTSSDVLANSYDTLMHTYTTSGLIVPKANVWFYHSRIKGLIYVAIEKAPMIAVAGLSNWDAMFLSLYRFVKGGHPVSVFSAQLVSIGHGGGAIGQKQTQITNALALHPAGVSVYVNGYDIALVPGTPVPLALGNYVDIVIDTTVIAKYSVNLTTTATGYFSTQDNCYKEVIHTPKALNPTNLLCTVELWTMTARRNDTQVGVYLHRNAPNAVTQITHNDVGLLTEVVDAFRSSLGSQDISVEVKLRSHTNVLLRQIDYIDYLYITDDATILQFLTGQGDATLPFWTAQALEQSAYIGFMNSLPSVIIDSTVGNYIAALGYYTVLAALCQQTNNYLITRLPVAALSVAKPLVLQGMDAYPVVYLDGVKLQANQVGYANSRHDKLVIGLTADVYYTTGQTLSVDVIEAGSAVPYLFVPSLDTPSLTVPFASVSVFQKHTPTVPVVGAGVSASTSWIPITPQPLSPVQLQQPTLASTEVVFSSACYGNTYMIQNGTFSRVYSKDITSAVAAVASLHIELTTLATDNTTVVPLLGYLRLDVYLNGRRLINGIDYAANPLCDPDGNPAIVQVMLANRQFLNLSGSNYLEVIARTALNLGREVGYVVNNRLNIGNNVTLWFNGLANAFANGKLLINPGDDGNLLVPSPPVANALAFEITTEIPSFVGQILTGFTARLDDQRIALINTYLGKQTPSNDISTVIIPRSWQVFSPYLAAIIADAVASPITPYAEDPDPVLFMAQFAAYQYLLANDPTLTPAISAIDIRFVDIFPTYNAVTVANSTTWAVLRQLASTVLPDDADTLGEILDG